MPKTKKNKASQEESPSGSRANQSQFFKARPQPPESQAPLSEDPSLLVILTELMNEIKEHNKNERIKLKNERIKLKKEADQKQSEAESAEKAKIEDQERHSHLSRTMYM